MKEVDGMKEVVEEVEEIIVAYYSITKRISTFRGFSVCNIHALVRLKTMVCILKEEDFCF